MINQFYFQFSIALVICLHYVKMSNSVIWLIDKTLLGAINPGRYGPGSDSNERVLRIPQNSSIPDASESDCFMTYQGHSLGLMLTSQ